MPTAGLSLLLVVAVAVVVPAVVPAALPATAGVLAPSAARAEAPDEACRDAVDQATLSACAQQAYEVSAKALNRLYSEIEQRLGQEGQAKQLFAKAQQSWAAFRDAECTFAASATSGGSAFPMVQALCLDDLTQRRIRDLQQYLVCPEGDLGCPVPSRH